MSDFDLVPFYAAIALTHMLSGDVENAKESLRCIPRSQRGRLNKALEDLAMSMSRLGPDG